MKKTICDRCGNEIKDIYISNPETLYTHYDIRATIYTKTKHPCATNGQMFIDLCPSCEMEFSNWLHNKEARG